MATMKELRDERLRKLEQLKTLGVDPYPSESSRSNEIKDVIDNFEEFSGDTVTLAGRLITTRKFGKLAFFVLRDIIGQIQKIIKSDLI